ncbi:MAG TPA: endonuclease domain-containing protein [Candidatus Acidoferrum sp.]|nr:endonuclease domain-containing protein [Candidatus Acidoferrum sp.]
MDAQVQFLRRHQTYTELKLWQQLRRKQIGNRRFRRQHRLGQYIVDFVCLSTRLIIEIDGPSHDVKVAEDDLRTAWLESQGFRLLRFTNAQVLRDLDSVIETIAANLNKKVEV